MTERALECSKCGQEMEPGIILDNKVGNEFAQSAWVDGQPEKNFWTGLALKGHQRLPIRTFRCTKCGYLESYATPA